jgi:anti-sigma regulatory factor (Ser/Thr protein kinase)
MLAASKAVNLRWRRMQAALDGFSLDIVSDLSEAARATLRLEAFGRAHDLPETLIGRFALALDELMTNIVQHGQAAGARETIRVSLALAADGMSMEVSDPGRAFNPLLEAPPPDLDSPLEARRIGGLGVHLVVTLMDRASYRREAERNIVTVWTALPAGSSA